MEKKTANKMAFTIKPMSPSCLAKLSRYSFSVDVSVSFLELAILKTLGFRDMTVLRVVLAESILITSVGYVGGMGFAALCLTLAERFVPAIVQLGSLGISFETCITGFAVAVGMGILVGLPPAVQAKRVNIIDALRSH